MRQGPAGGEESTLLERQFSVQQIVDKRDDYKLISLKWIFIYKSDFDDFFFKYKARIVIRDDLQKVDNTQNVYAATLALKIFRMMMTFVVDFHFKIK
jgi:hypothetical protein